MKVSLFLFALILITVTSYAQSKIKDDDTGMYYLEIEGEMKGPFTFATSVYSSKSGNKWCYLYSTKGDIVHNSLSQVKDREQFLVTEKTEYGPFSYVNWRSLDYSTYKNVLFFKGEKDDGAFAFVGGNEYGPYSEVSGRFFFFNQDKDWAVKIVKNAGSFDGHMIGGKQFILFNGKAYGGVTLINSWEFNKDFSKIIIWGSEKGEPMHEFEVDILEIEK